MNLRALLLVSPAILVSACTSSGSPNNGDSTPAAGTDPAPSGVSISAHELSAHLKSSVADVDSVHTEVGVSLSAQQLAGSGVEQLSDGRLVALDLTEQLAGVGDIRIVYVGGRTYAKLPISMNTSGKPFLVVSRTSSNATISTLAPYLDSVLSAVSLGSASVLTGAAKSIELKGTEQVRGITATHYAVQVEIAKLPDTYPGKAELEAGGARTLPLDLYVDAHGRPVKVAPHLTVQGQDVPITAEYSDYGTPVHIAAPPASQVGA
jgi:hypothetical protein